MNNDTNLSEEEVLMAFSVEPTPGRETLVRYLKRFPQHRDALIACSLELELESGQQELKVLNTTKVVGDAWNSFQQTMGQKAIVNNPFGSLDSAAFRALAQRVSANALLLARVRDRAISFATIPHRFVENLAAEIGVSIDVISTYLSAPPAIVSMHKFRADDKPAVSDQIPFAQAVETSQLTQEQKQALLDMVD